MTPESGFLFRTTGRRPYAVYCPRGWDRATPLPAILYLHGRGESGSDGARQLLIGLPSAILHRASQWPFLVVCPQKPTLDAEWFDQRRWLNRMLRDVDDEFPTDASRRYLTGLSQGGRGTMRLAKSLVWDFAAAAPVCGWAEPSEVAANFKNLPVWAFHGLADEVIPARGSIDAIDAVPHRRKRLTLLEGVGHNSWDYAYREADLARWFLRHRKK